MYPGRFPVDLHRAEVHPRRRGFSLSFAICLVLGPAIFLAILAYEGSIADNPSQFNDDPIHHHQDLPHDGPLKFCAYLDERNHIQAKAGPCNDSDTTEIHQTNEAAVTRDFCVEELSDGSFDITSCSDTMTSVVGPRQLSVRRDVWNDHNDYGTHELENYGEDEDLEAVRYPAHIPCYTARPGGWWEPCSQPKGTVNLREVPETTTGFCIHLGPNRSSTSIHNSTCFAAKSGAGPPATCNKCVSVSAVGKKEYFACYLRSVDGNAEVVKCSESIRYSRKDSGNADGASNEVPRCFVLRSDGTIESTNYDSPGAVLSEERTTLLTPEGICLKIGPGQEIEAVPCSENSTSSALLPHDLEPLSPPILKRATPPTDNNSDTLADEPEKWISTNRCTKDFCDWVKIPGEIRNRCYAKDDKNASTPPMSDEALKYTAPYECNLCLELGVHHEDTARIEQHCLNVIAQENFNFEILAGTVGGILLLCAILGFYSEHRKRKENSEKPVLSLPTSRERSRKRNGQTFVLPVYDGSADLYSLLSSITASQRDAPEINIVSPPRSVISEGRLKIPVMPTATQSLNRPISLTKAHAQEFEAASSHFAPPPRSYVSEGGLKVTDHSDGTQMAQIPAKAGSELPSPPSDASSHRGSMSVPSMKQK